MTVEREATRIYVVVEENPVTGGWQVREILAAELRVTAAGALEAVEPLTGEVAVCWAPRAWQGYTREFLTRGSYDEDDPGNYPHGRVSS